MKKIFLALILLTGSCLVCPAQPNAAHNLTFDTLAKRWDEGMPLGNGWLGALVYQKGNNLRMSLDRVDLWDDRPMPKIGQLKFDWVVQQVLKNKYDTVQQIGDAPYEANAAPTKIPGAALEFDISKLGKVMSSELDISTALYTLRFETGTIFTTYIHASKLVGYFSFSHLMGDLIPMLKAPPYAPGNNGRAGNSVEGQGLERLGYARATISSGKNFLRYHQPTWKGNYYEVLVQWQRNGDRVTGAWTISNNSKASLPVAGTTMETANEWREHLAWWKNYWGKSAVSIPDTLLEKQYYLELYKMGCVARTNTPPISLQAIWSADNGNLPPWKGDLHHDLNTELSYWPFYNSNHLTEAASFTNWMWKVKPENERWTKAYFGTEGLNVPGVTTISGKPMGGWIQYSMSPTTSLWLAQNFYWQWKYGGDKKFLQQQCLPYLAAVENYITNNWKWDPVTQKKKLLLSSSPEYHDNSVNAWFRDYTNYDLALIRGLYNNYLELLAGVSARAYNAYVEDSRSYPDLDTNATGLSIAPGQNLDESHRHHAHLMAIYPIGLLSPDRPADQDIISKSLRHLEQIGTRQWCGYSFSWAACIYARAREGDNAARMLKIFAGNFVSSNSFHLNGDQHGGQYSDFTYRPFTLEGNFAYAQGIHEMLMQSYNGYIEIFPAVPPQWKNISFKTLRAEGAFLVSANKVNGVVEEVTILAEQGGTLNLKLPFKTFIPGNPPKKYKLENGRIAVEMKKDETFTIKNAYE